MAIYGKSYASFLKVIEISQAMATMQILLNPVSNNYHAFMGAFLSLRHFGIPLEGMAAQFSIDRSEFRSRANNAMSNIWQDLNNESFANNATPLVATLGRTARAGTMHTLLEHLHPGVGRAHFLSALGTSPSEFRDECAKIAHAAITAATSNPAKLAEHCAQWDLNFDQCLTACIAGAGYESQADFERAYIHKQKTDIKMDETPDSAVQKTLTIPTFAPS